MAGFPQSPPPADATMSRNSRTASGVQSVAVSHTIRFASLTDVGVKRSHNQDALRRPTGRRRRRTSRTAGTCSSWPTAWAGTRSARRPARRPSATSRSPIQKHVAAEGAEAAIRRAFAEANAGIHADRHQTTRSSRGWAPPAPPCSCGRKGRGSATSATAGRTASAAGGVEQLTFDHSWVWEIARRQGIDPDELGDFKRNVIIRSLGPDAEVEVDIEGPHPVAAGRRVPAVQRRADQPGDAGRDRGGGDRLAAGRGVRLPDRAGEPPRRAGQHHLPDRAGAPRGRPDHQADEDAAGPDWPAARGAAWWGRTRHLAAHPAGGRRRAGRPVHLDAAGEHARRGVGVAFVLAAVLTLAGLGGLALQLRRKGDAGRRTGPTPTANCTCTRRTRSTSSQELCERFARGGGGRAQVGGRTGWPRSTWPPTRSWPPRPRRRRRRATGRTAFRARCLALQLARRRR